MPLPTVILPVFFCRLSPSYYNKMPAIQAVIKHAKEPAIIAFLPKRAASPFLEETRSCFCCRDSKGNTITSFLKPLNNAQ
ncbi:MAG: hypothetical protein ACRCT1_14310 [Microcoleaceae cyanobacterium]